MIGPAIAGLLIAGIGTGWVFLINAASFIAVIAALLSLRTGELHRRERAQRKRGSFMEGFRYVRRRPDMLTVFAMLFLVATFGLNFAVFVSTMAVTAFHSGAGAFGFLTSMLAVGSVSGALFAARREKPLLSYLIGGAAVFGMGLAAAALMPTYALFGVTLVAVGLSAQTFNTTANSSIQLFHGEQLHSAVDRARDARARDGDLHRDHPRMHASGRAAGRLGCRSLRSALVARGRCGRGRPRRAYRGRVSGSPSRLARALSRGAPDLRPG
jgi:MFS family permease